MEIERNRCDLVGFGERFSAADSEKWARDSVSFADSIDSMASGCC